MMLRKARFFWAALSFAPIFCPPCLRAACECEAIPFEERMDRASSVFLGRLLESATNRSSGKRRLLFEVVDSYKGEPREDFYLADADQGQPCELVIQEGKYYVVFAHWQWGVWLTSKCWGTKLADEAKEESEKLGLPDSQKDKLYAQLRKRCMGLYTTPCCLASVRSMEKGYYLPEPEAGCPAGTKPNTLQCLGALRWCIPISEKYRKTESVSPPVR